MRCVLILSQKIRRDNRFSSLQKVVLLVFFHLFLQKILPKNTRICQKCVHLTASINNTANFLHFFRELPVKWFSHVGNKKQPCRLQDCFIFFPKKRSRFFRNPCVAFCPAPPRNVARNNVSGLPNKCPLRFFSPRPTAWGCSALQTLSDTVCR